MISNLGSAISRVFYRVCPDPFVIAILLTLVTAALALVFGDFPTIAEGESRASSLLDAWRVEDGIWKFLAFSMQMCLILVTGHALASTRLVRRLIDALASLPRSAATAAAMVGFVAAFAGVINWGLGLIVGALMARETGRVLQKRGIPAHYPLLAAAGYLGLLVWHGGFSGSAPLAMTTAEGAAKVLPAAYVERLGPGGLPLDQTILSGMNFFVTGGLLLGAPLVCFLLTPREGEAIRPISNFRVPELDSDFNGPPAGDDPEHVGGVPDRLDRSAIIAWLLALPLIVAVIRYGYVSGAAIDDSSNALTTTLRGFKRVGLNEINAFMLGFGLLLHGSPIRYMRAVEDGARGCAGIIVQFPLYAGIMAMMVASGLVRQVADGFIALGNSTTIPFFSFLSAAVVNLFVPSGGGQWGIQGPIALEAALEVDASIGKMVMAVAYGDQLTNMLQPFWALPLLAITGARARDIVGYTCVVMLFAAVWISIGLFIF
ncbi:MAG: short-chain fatty acid transporter [Phycisphaerales bacterium]